MLNIIFGILPRTIVVAVEEHSMGPGTLLASAGASE